MLNFVIFSLSRWNENFGCNIRDISYELAKNHKVLFIDVPLKRKDKWFHKELDRVKEVEIRDKEGNNLVQISNNLWHYIDFSVLESVNSINNSLLFDIINKINNQKFAKVIQNAIKKLKFDSYILLNDNDIYNGIYLRKYLTPSLYVYYLRDRLSAMNYWNKHVTRLEPILINEVDLVVANSVYLADSAALLNQNSYYIGQGCDISHFATQPDNEEIEKTLNGIKKPIIGYIGALNSERLDIKLMFELATVLNNFNFVLVGREDADFEKSDLHKLSNVYFTGNQEFSQLPKYLYSFDVAINPQLFNEITIGNYPRKIDEYLAAGVPVVATETPTMKPFAKHVYLANTTSDYITLIQKAITENSDERKNARKAFAQNHNWTNSVDLLIKYCYLKLNENK